MAPLNAEHIEKEPISSYPALFISVPHLNDPIDAQSGFPGEPTPLLHALAVTEAALEKNQFPSASIPDIQPILHPQVYTAEFEKQLICELQSKNPRVVGLSNISEGHANALKIAKIVKTYCPDCILIIGGPHEDDTNFKAIKKGLIDTRKRLQKTGQILPPLSEQLAVIKQYETLSNPANHNIIDFVVSGDGAYLLMHLLTLISTHPESSITELKKYILENQADFQTVPGSGYLCFYNPETKEIVRIPISGKAINRNNLPFLHRSRLSSENRHAIIGISSAAEWQKYDRKFQNNFCGDKNQDEYFENKRGGIYLNSASITKPFASSHKKAAKNFLTEQDLSPDEKEKIFEDARNRAAKLINLPDSHGIVLCRNTTEAINIAMRLSGATDKNEVLISDIENVSVQQAVNFHFDHGNPEGRNPWCSYPTWYRKRFSAQPTYPSVSPQLSGITTLELKILNQSLTEIYHQIDNYLYEYPNISTVILSHVIRDSGQELPIREICNHIRSQNSTFSNMNKFIIVDGAQAVGNLPQINFCKLNCDAYAFTPHKTLKSAGVVGILAINPENDLTNNNLPLLNKSDPRKGEIILEGMFHKSLGIKPNVPDSLCTADSIGFSAAIEELENKYGLTNNDFNQISANRQTLKDYFIKGLQKLSASAGIPMVLPSNPAPTSFILNFQILARNMHEIAANLSSQGVFLSYIEHDPDNPERNYLRASFDISQTHDEIDQALTILAKILQITPKTD